jgi:hypothetical protein
MQAGFISISFLMRPFGSDDKYEPLKSREVVHYSKQP